MSEDRKILIQCDGCETPFKVAQSQIRSVTRNIRCPSPKCDNFLDLISVKAELEDEIAVAKDESSGAGFWYTIVPCLVLHVVY